MQLKDLVKPISEQTDEELRERLRGIRHNRTVVRPAAAKHVERTERKTSRRALSAIEKLLEQMSPEERVEFLKKLEQGEQGGTGETQT